MKNQLTPFALVASLLLLFAGCKKETTEPTPAPESYLGRYVVSSPGFDFKYIEISQDTFYVYSEEPPYGIRSLEAYSYTGNDSTFKFYYGSAKKYSIKDGVLTVEGTPYYSGTIKAVKSNDVPSANSWVKRVFLSNIGAVNTGGTDDRYYDMSSYGYNKVVTEPHSNGTKYVFKVLELGTDNYTSTEIAVDPAYTSRIGYEDNIEYYNNKFLVYEWGNPNSYLYRIDPSTGLEEASILVTNPVGNISALATDGVSLFGMTNTGIRKFDFVNNAWGYEAATGGNTAMAGRNGYLYFASPDRYIIQKFNPTTNKVEGAYIIPDNYSIVGLAFVDDYTLVACLYDYNTTTYSLYRIYL